MRNQAEYGWRLLILVIFLLVAALGLLGRIVYLGVLKSDFLSDQSNIRSIREVSMPVTRGIITDRNSEPLAISIPVASVWANPKLISTAKEQDMVVLASSLGLPLDLLKKKLLDQKGREFVYLKRSVPLEKASQVMELKVPGIFLEKGYKRYYPESEAAAHVVGFTNIDDVGQEGLELAYDSWLRGTPGKKRVVKDRVGNTIASLDVIKEPHQGKDLKLSIDRRVQYLVYNELKEAIKKHRAESGSAVVLSVKTGEVLAMVNMPSYNPNNRKGTSISSMRNRAVTDVFEPGSTIKAFSVANALASGKYNINTLVDTSPGVFKVDKHLIYDDGHRNNGVLSVKKVLQKSSDIGVAKMTLSLPSESLIDMLQKVGFGKSTQSGFPGEASGILPSDLSRRKFVLATLSFGYSVSVTPLQLAKSYAILAAGGLDLPITFLKQEGKVSGKQVLSSKLSKTIMDLLESVISAGTGRRAKVPGYRVAGKTGTAHVASPKGGYYEDRHFSNFVGIAPVSNPQLVVAVLIKNPKGAYRGGLVAAPLFASIMNGALRILGVPLDDVKSL